MDGLKDTVPLGIPGDDEGFTGFLFSEEEETPEADDCKIYNHRSGKSMLYKDLKGEMASMKFDFVIGNPPYQDETVGDNDTFAPPVYHLFMEGSVDSAHPFSGSRSARLYVEFPVSGYRHIFNAPTEVIDIIRSLPNAPEGDLVDVSQQTREDLSVNADGEVELPNEYVIGRSKEVFGEKIYQAIEENIQQETERILSEPTPEAQQIEQLRNVFKEELISPVINKTKENYGTDLKKTEVKQIQKQLEQKTEKIVTQELGDYSIQKKKIENERDKALETLHESGKTAEEVHEEFDTLLHEATERFKERVSTVL